MSISQSYPMSGFFPVYQLASWVIDSDHYNTGSLVTS